MKITLDNFEQVFGNLDAKLQVFDDIKEDDIKKIIDKLKKSINDIHEGGKQLKADNAVLKIGVVGKVKAGKSSFLNSLFFDGENVLPRASTPMTAGLTVLRYGEKNSFVVEYYNQKEWQVFEDRAKAYDDMVQELGDEDNSFISEEYKAYKAAKELVANCGRNAKAKIKEESQKEEHAFNDIKDLQDVLEKYVGADGDFTSITKCLVINLHDERLKDIQIVDTPGVDDPVLSREQRTREFLRSCHGVFFLSFSSGFFNTTDVSFLTNRIGNQGIGTVVVIASKFDAALQDLSVANEFKEDLAGAVENVLAKLKKQMNNNLSTSNFKGDDPLLDFSSGIGYSIAKKSPSSWDETENKVVSQMRRFYPSFFGTNEEVVDIFRDLSNIDAIRADYLEKVFMRKKDNIIKKKVDAYFENASEGLRVEIKKETDVIEDRIKALENGDLDKIQEQKVVTESIIKEIKSDINTVSTRAVSIADKSAKECLNGFTFRWSGRIPTTLENRTFMREGTIFGADRSFDCSFEKVDLNSLIEDVNRLLDKSLDALYENWTNKTSKMRDLISDSVNKVITDNEIKDKRGCLDAKMLRNTLDDILDAMLSENTLDLHSIRQSFSNQLTNNLSGLDEIGYQKACCKEAEARANIHNAADTCKREVASVVNSVVNAVHHDVEKALIEAREKSVAIFTKRKDEFILGVTDKMKEVLSQLEKDLKNKEEKLIVLNKVYQELQKIGMEL